MGQRGFTIEDLVSEKASHCCIVCDSVFNIQLLLSNYPLAFYFKLIPVMELLLLDGCLHSLPTTKSPLLMSQPQSSDGGVDKSTSGSVGISTLKTCVTNDSNFEIESLHIMKVKFDSDFGFEDFEDGGLFIDDTVQQLNTAVPNLDIAILEPYDRLTGFLNCLNRIF